MLAKRFELAMACPDGAAWKMDGHGTPWIRAAHEPTHSSLLLRSWAEDSNVTRKGCYARAREWEPHLPDLDAERLIDDKTRALLGSRDARVAVGVLVPPDPQPAPGCCVLAILGDVPRCALCAYQTRTSG